MASRILLLTLCLSAAAWPVMAASQGSAATTVAPPGTSETRYCMRIEAMTGSRIEEVQCWTRLEWADQGVDVDRDWAKEGVRTIG